MIKLYNNTANYFLPLLLSLTLGVLIAHVDYLFGENQFFIFILNLIIFGIVLFVPPIIKRCNLFELPVFLAIQSFLLFGLFNIIYFIEGTTYVPSIMDDLEWLNLALFYFTISSIFLWLGYFSKIPSKVISSSKILKRAFYWTPKILGLRYGTVLILLLISVVSRIVLIKTGHYGYLIMGEQRYEELLSYAQILYFSGDFLGRCLVLSCGIAYFKFRSVKTKYILLIVLSVDTLLRILGGFKGDSIMNLLLIGILSYLIVGKHLVKYFIYGFLFLLLLIPVNLAYRASILEVNIDRISLLSISSKVASIAEETLLGNKKTSQESFFDNIKGALEFFSRSQAQLIFPASIIRYYNEETGAKFWWGKEYFIFPLLFIPRVVWPEKSFLNKGLWMTQEVMGMTSIISYSPTSTFGDFYLNFGFIGVIFGMFLLGIIMKIIYFLLFKGLNEIKLFFYIIILLSFMASVDPQMIKGLIEALLIAYFILKMVLRYAPGQSPI
jgi:hypothetical protein